MNSAGWHSGATTLERANPFALYGVGTLDQPERTPPDIHIFTSSKQPWVVIPPDATQVSEYYRKTEHWPPEALKRWESVQHG